jgi:hypothetical protein
MPVTHNKTESIDKLIGNKDSTEFLTDVASRFAKAGEYRLAKRLFDLSYAERNLRREEVAGFEEELPF